MPAATETIKLSLEDAAALVRGRRVSPVELTEAALARIEAVEPRLNAFVTVTADLARAQARQAGDEIAAGNYRGLLHGIPIAVKDLFATKGIRTTAGSRILADWIPDEDATVVRRLREAGAVLLGKLGLHEFAYGVSSVNPHFGDVHNPWDTTKIPGGSSGGSAVAVVAGEAYATLGSDTGGSIRIPASLCGCVGLKPTFGRASLFGAVPLAWSLDHPGPLARTVRDVAVATAAISGFDPRDPISAERAVPDLLEGIDAGPQKLRVGVPTDHVWDECDPAIAKAVRSAIEALARAGADVVEIRWPRAAEYAKASSAVLGVEARAYHEGTFPGRASEYGPLIRSRLSSQGDVDAETYARSMRLLLEARAGTADRDLDGVDVLAMPTVPSRPWTIEEAKEIPRPSEWTRITRIFDLTGQPAISVPCGMDPDGIPIGLQFAARMWDEAAALRAARAYELVRGPFPLPSLDG
ncbi:MAG TPA: amidase [Candidatus Polarisedimenticolia bacterium]|nr:amidase [Candidatus Polarisedimenticolia bacterium]